MSDTSADAPTPRWWPGRTSAIISAVLAAWALPFLAITIWVLFEVLLSSPCDPSTKLGSDPCYGENLGNGYGFLLGIITLFVGGSLMIAAAGLFLRPGLRARVMRAIFAFTIGFLLILLVGGLIALR